MNDVLLPNELTLDEHVLRIRDAMGKARDAIFDVATAIKDCQLQLGTDTLQQDVAERLGMSKSTLNKWIAIANSDFILANRKQVPPTFTGLYYLTRLEKKYEEFYPNKAQTNLTKLISDGRLLTTSQHTDVQAFITEIQRKIDAKKKRELEKKNLSLTGRAVASTPASTTLADLVSQHITFRTIVVTLSPNHLSEWSDSGFLKADIQSDFPLHELRAPSITETVTCLLPVPMNRINVGLKALSAFGFSYRDTFVPAMAVPGLHLLNTQVVVLRGERGKPATVQALSLNGTTTENLVEYAEANLAPPYLSVFSKVARDHWTCVN